nr:MAG TPA: hypothetical protein [Caudoviricetes sp.]
MLMMLITRFACDVNDFYYLCYGKNKKQSNILIC